MNKKRIFILIVLLLIISLTIGGTYALWKITSDQANSNTLGTNCFEITLQDKTKLITIEKAHPISDTEGLTGEGYTFSVKNTCDTYATYEVNLENILSRNKQLPNEYIKYSINDGTPITLTSRTTSDPVNEDADVAYQLTSGSLAPDEEDIYTLKLWLDEDTPPISNVMNAEFLSKIVVVGSYIEKENLTNEMTFTITTDKTEYTKISETITIKAISTKYKIIEYSYDKNAWTSITPMKEIIIKQVYSKEGSFKVYFKDEVGNINDVEIVTSYLDQTAPTIYVEIEEAWDPNLKIRMEDSKSGLAGYQLTNENIEPLEWKSASGNRFEMIEKISEEGTYYLWSKDQLDNISYQEIVVNKVDKIKPTQSFRVENSTLGSNGWYKSVNLKVNLIDNESGISSAKYCFTTSESCIPNQNIAITENTFNYIFGNSSANQKICVQTIDNSDNISEPTCSEAYKVDNDLPIANLQVSTTNDSIVINASLSTDNSSGITNYFYSLDGVNFIETTINNYTFSKLQNNNYTIYLKVKDSAGNISNVITKNAIINITRSWTFTSSTGFSVPYNGIYRVELWGEKGGSGALYNSQWTGGEGGGAGSGSNGSYIYGYIEMNLGTQLYFGVDVGGGTTTKGQSDPNPNDGNKWAYSYGGYGGGSSDIRINNSDLSNRIMVAGGGGGVTNSYGAYYRNNEPPGAINMYAGYSVWGGFSINGNETKSNGNFLYGSNGNGSKSGLFGLGPGAGGGGYYGGASGYAVPNQLIGGYRGTSYINTSYFFQYNSALNSKSSISVTNNGNANMSSPNFQVSQTTYQNALATITYIY